MWSIRGLLTFKSHLNSIWFNFSFHGTGLEHDLIKSMRVHLFPNTLKVTIGVNNLADRMPPSAPQAFGGDVGADLATYNPVGRLWYLSTSLKF